MNKKLSYEDIKNLEDTIEIDHCEKFFRSQLIEFINNIIEMKGKNCYKITEENMEDIINNLMGNDDIWEVIDEQISLELIPYEKK